MDNLTSQWGVINITLAWNTWYIVNDVKNYTMQTRGFPPTQRAKKNNGGYDEKLKPVESTTRPSVNIVLHNLLGRLTYKDSSGRERLIFVVLLLLL